MPNNNMVSFVWIIAPIACEITSVIIKKKKFLSKALPHLLQLPWIAVFLLGKHQVHFTHVIV